MPCGRVQPDDPASEGRAGLRRPVAPVELGHQRPCGQQADAVAAHRRGAEAGRRRAHLHPELDVGGRDGDLPGLLEAGQPGPGGDGRAARLQGDPVVLVIADGEPARPAGSVDAGGHGGAEVPLAAADELRVRVVQPGPAGDRQPAVHDRRDRLRCRADGQPARILKRGLVGEIEYLLVDGVARGEPHRFRLGPAACPGDRCAECLPSQRRERLGSAERAHAEQDQRGAAVWRGDQVRVPGVLDRAGRTGRAEHRVGRVPLERALRGGAPGDADAVPSLGAALGDEQVPVVAAAVQVRRLRELQPGARPQRARRLKRLPGVQVDPYLLDAQVLAELLAAGVQPGEGHVGCAVVVPGQVRVDAANAVDGDAVAPRAGRVGRGEDDASARAHRDRDDHVEDTIAVPDGRRPDAAAGYHVVHLDLPGPGHHVADVRPPGQVGAAVDRYPGQVLKGRGDQVVHAVSQHDARIRVEAGDQRVRQRHASSTFALSGRSMAEVPIRS